MARTNTLVIAKPKDIICSEEQVDKLEEDALKMACIMSMQFVRNYQVRVTKQSDGNYLVRIVELK